MTERIASHRTSFGKLKIPRKKKKGYRVKGGSGRKNWLAWEMSCMPVGYINIITFNFHAHLSKRGRVHPFVPLHGKQTRIQTFYFEKKSIPLR